MRPVCEGFYLSSLQIWEKVKFSRPPSMEEHIPQEEESSTSKFRFLKPLAIVTGKIISYIRPPVQ
jgi:hypothetical protein